MSSIKAKLLSSTGTAARPEWRGVIHGDFSTTELERRPDGSMHYRRYTPVSDELLKKNAEGRSRSGRIAPLGDSHGAWVKVGEIPLDFLLDRIPPDAWEDTKAVEKVLEEYTAFKAVPGRI